jgi:hypothetical protein
MDTGQIEQELRKAQTDLAFALAQGDGYAEDAAAERVAALETQLAKAKA